MFNPNLLEGLVMTSSTLDETQQNQELLRSDIEGVAHLTLNRPEARNSLSMNLLNLLQSQLNEIAETESVRVVVLEAEGKTFCAGHDLKEIRANHERLYHEKLFKQCSHLMMSILKLPQPVIAKVQGLATAAGCQLVATCDLAIASNVARFCTPGVHIGLFCSTPMVALSRNIARKSAMQMLLTGEEINAKTAEKYGLINCSVEHDQLDKTVNSYCSKIKNKSQLTLAIGKEAFYRQLEMGVSDAYQFTSEVMAKNMMAIDAEEGIDAFLEKREPIWKGE